MPDTDKALSHEELIERLIKVSRKVYQSLYLHIPATRDGAFTPNVTIDRCVVCKRMSVGQGVMHRPDCPVRLLSQVLSALHQENKQASVEVVTEEVPTT